MNAINRQTGMKGMLALMFALSIVISGCSSDDNKEGASTNKQNEQTPAADNTATNADTKGEPTEAELPQVELTWHYGTGALQPDQQEVQDAVNAYLKDNTKLNATIKLVPYDFGSYDQKMNPMIAANENMDIVWTTASWLLSYSQNVSKGAFLALDDLLPKYAPKTAKEMMPDKFWEDIKNPADGKVYAIPNYQVAATAAGFVFRKDLVDKYNFDITSVKKTADLEPFLKTLKENEPDIIPFAFQDYRNIPDYGNELRNSGWIWYYKNNPFIPVDTNASPERLAYWNLIHSWYEKGYVYQDLATVKDFDAFIKEGNVAVSTDVTFKPGGEFEMKTKNGGHEVVRQQLKESSFTGVNATMNAISKNSKNPERALMFLELVNTDKTLYHLLCYGIKGKHYNEVDGYYQAIEGSGYNPGIDWVFGNQFNGLLREGQPKDLWEQTKQLNESAEVSPLYAFHFNSESVKTEEAAINAVNDEYLPMLNFGVADPATMLPKYKAALEKAGQKTVEAEVKKQLDAWMAATGAK
ncbi:ABC transporter substrate-binding protein [Paenibacillus lignilyticus]|uniref:ABC transporter substrate-binding protein n=1 Tax=Paenibacillus lignilyticus TaxID=1172615 RepID=A0ABS5C9D2_9BACL|nr:ABC transporter substrate-binding protein [Paenibacillus lignilyticus]MBP3962606.1 ABC transporter substrate-binding protein [Paenibacillus lignilyticus]